MKTYLGLLSIFLIISCGKQSKPLMAVDNKLLLGQYIDPIKTSGLSTDEINTGKAICSALSYKRANFLSIYSGSGSIKNFVFKLKSKGCQDAEETHSVAEFKYSMENNVLSYVSTSPAGLSMTLVAETDKTGGMTEFCSANVGTESKRWFGTEADFKLYYFYKGSEGSKFCHYDLGPNDACVMASTVENNVITSVKYFHVLLNFVSNPYSNSNLRGQEFVSENFQNCTSGNSSFKMSLQTIK